MYCLATSSDQTTSRTTLPTIHGSGLCSTCATRKGIYWSLLSSLASYFQGQPEEGGTPQNLAQNGKRTVADEEKARDDDSDVSDEEPGDDLPCRFLRVKTYFAS